MSIAISLSEVATTAQASVATQAFLRDNAATGAESVSTGGAHVLLAEKATTRDSVQASSGTLANGRYIR